MTTVLRRVRGEAGVALVTVMLVGAALTALSSMAAFVAVRELKSGRDDRKGVQALAYAEAGIDRIMGELKRGLIDWADIRESGCARAPLRVQGNIGNGGSYVAELSVFEAPDLLPRSPWTGSDTSQRPCVRADGSPRPTSPRDDAAFKHMFAITSTGTHPAATRVVRQTIQINVLNLPIGIYADNVEANGSTSATNLSLISPGDVYGREKIAFSGLDPYYKLSDFWFSYVGSPSDGQAPAAVHTTGAINMKKATGQPDVEHPPNRNCNANPTPGGGTAGQSLWDQSGLGGTISSTCPNWSGPPAGFPPTSLMTGSGDSVQKGLQAVVPTPTLSDQDFLTLRQSAKTSGLYCLIRTSGTRECTRAGELWPFGGTVAQADVNYITTTKATPQFVAYFEFEDATKAATNSIGWNQASVWPCPDRSVVLAVRNGGIDMQSNQSITGAILIPEGSFFNRGTLTINGTIIAKSFNNSGNSTFRLDDCWVNNFPGPFLNVTPIRWMELDR